MSQTYQVCEVTVMLPSLGTLTTDSAGNNIKRGDKCRVQLYAAKPDTRAGIPFDGYVVGVISFNGYTESPFKRSQKILMPDGYKLLALRVDDDGVPTSWDSLPVHFSGDYICKPFYAEADIRGCCPIEGFEWGWFVDKSGQAYIHKALIGDGVLSTSYHVIMNVADKEKPHEAGMAIDVEDAKSRVKILAEKFAVAENTQTALEIALQQSIKKVVGETIQQAMQPGGAIWNSLRRGF
ncbi:DUF1983 domain-containing protein [Cronobacter turicensis]|nr:DUF1983 domain-containing protein [Cronobacter turicensis]EMA1790374.1 DUF1983 domain-containing protein [Cronobacter turicensis]EMA1799350.1 DUF1983 domain-containing protein [Cronobacter turicensis]EMA1847651.1 DUF1983 domain-containing protein [Cronobacter turicensis]EMA1857896.1 DUF1983 domain-containing protein [Cronobacter turicensis]